jgi:cytoskeletal protein CcmA (bactofilin family)
MSNDENMQSVITSDVEIKGSIKSAGAVHLDGKLEGDLTCAGDAIIGKNATVKGTINANSVIIEGAINGTIIAKDKIEMKSTARVMCDIKAKRLSVEDGVTFIGKSEVNPAGIQVAAATGKSAVSLTSSLPPLTR